MSTLRIRISGDAKRWAELPQHGKLVIGSSADQADFVVEGQGVDGAHCAIGRVKDGGWAVMDLGSQYGTNLNGKPVKTARLKEGDRLVVGSRSIEIYDPSQAASSSSKDEQEELSIEEPAPAAAKVAEPAREASVSTAPRAAKPVSSSAQKQLGGFRLDRQLGRGGMGEVWLALQESLNRPVALKIMSTKLAGNAEFVRQFQREARAAAALSHPNVVVVHDVGEADGHHYLSMEYMAGGSLEDRVAREGALPWRQVLDALSDAGKGLMYAEERKIVHRDIKPANLMVGGQGTIKIADLGLAKSTLEDDSSDSDTRIQGTPHFIAPEQARGETVDHRADLYALGGTAYRLLTGRTPFEGETTREILRGHLTQDPTPPSEIVEGLPDGLDALVLRLLEKAPADRFSSAKELVEAVDGLRLAADNFVLPTMTAKSGGLGKLAMPIAGLVVLAALGGVAWKLTSPGENGTSPSDTQAETTNTAANTDDGVAPANVAVNTDAPDGDFFKPLTDSGPSTAEAEARLEGQLETQNLRAELEYRDIPAELLPSERVVDLRKIVETYPGTAVAASCANEIVSLEASILNTAEQSQALAALRTTALGDMRAAISWPPPEGSTFRLIDTLRAADAFPTPGALAQDEGWTQVRNGLREDVLTQAQLDLARRFASALELKHVGEFDALKLELATLVADLELPSDGLDPELAAVKGLKLLAQDVRIARDSLDADRSLFETTARQQHREQVAALLGPGAGFVDKLQALELAELAQVAEHLTSFGTSSSSGRLGAMLTAEIRDARAALDALSAGWAAGGWRRRTVSDPLDKRRSAREVLSVQPDGLTLADTGFVAWATFGAEPILIDQLFKSRLSRSYTTPELRGIAALLHWSLAARVAQIGARGLPVAKLKRVDAKPYDAALKAVRSVLTRSEFSITDLADVSQRLQRELEASEQLARVLRSSEAGTWAETVALLESFYRQFDDTLILHLLSDATDWHEAETQ